MPLYLDAVVSMVSSYNACRVSASHCKLWQAVVSEQALFFANSKQCLLLERC